MRIIELLDRISDTLCDVEDIKDSEVRSICENLMLGSIDLYEAYNELEVYLEGEC